MTAGRFGVDAKPLQNVGKGQADAADGRLGDIGPVKCLLEVLIGLGSARFPGENRCAYGVVNACQAVAQRKCVQGFRKRATYVSAHVQVLASLTGENKSESSGCWLV